MPRHEGDSRPYRSGGFPLGRLFGVPVRLRPSWLLLAVAVTLVYGVQVGQARPDLRGAAAFALGIPDLHPRLCKLVGRMRYRTHHGQNLLAHAQEVAWIAAHMADELGAKSAVVRRASGTELRARVPLEAPA